MKTGGILDKPQKTPKCQNFSAYVRTYVRTSKVAIRATPTDVLRMILRVARENETAGMPREEC